MTDGAKIIRLRAILAVQIAKDAMSTAGYNAYHAAPLAAEIMRQLAEDSA